MSERINPQTTNIGIYCAYAMEGVEGGVQDKVRCTSELLKEKGYNVHIFAPLNAKTDEIYLESIYKKENKSNKHNR